MLTSESAGSVPSFDLSNVAWSREPCDFQIMQGVRAHDGWTEKGGIAVVANQLGIVAKTLISARNELNCEATPNETNGLAYPSAFMVNGLLASSTTGLQAVMDSVASLCNDLARDDDFSGDIHFNTFPFCVTSWDFIKATRRDKIRPLRFDGLSFDELANKLKHTQPWLGYISQGNPDCMKDIHDAQGVGVLRRVLVPIYNEVKSIVERIGSKYNQSVTLPHV